MSLFLTLLMFQVFFSKENLVGGIFWEVFVVLGLGKTVKVFMLTNNHDLGI